MKHLSLSLPMIILISLLNVNSLMGQVKWNKHFIFDRIAAQNMAGNLPDGVYYVVCKGGPHISSQRLIIAK